jgi:hypothetical protein
MALASVMADLVHDSVRDADDMRIGVEFGIADVVFGDQSESFGGGLAYSF